MADTTRPPTQRHALQAFGMAALIEGAIVAVAVILLAGSLAHKPPISDPVTITLADDPPPPDKPEEPKPVPPPPTPQPRVKIPVKQVAPRPQATPEPATPPVTETPSPVAAAPSAFSEPAPTPPVSPVSPVPPSVARPDIQATFDAKVKGAVNAWHNANYPVAATTMHFAGKTQVEFHLRDGVASGVRILTSCGVGLFDQASLHAVQGASYPETPAELRGHDNLYQIWVEYRN